MNICPKSAALGALSGILGGIAITSTMFYSPTPTVYASSMGMSSPVVSLMRVECHGQDPKSTFTIYARSLGIAVKGQGAKVLVEIDSGPPDKYSPADQWLTGDSLCWVYVGEPRE